MLQHPHSLDPFSGCKNVRFREEKQLIFAETGELQASAVKAWLNKVGWGGYNRRFTYVVYINILYVFNIIVFICLQWGYNSVKDV